MKFHSTESVCALTGASRANLRRWLRGGLISENRVSHDWNALQIDEVLAVMVFTADGAEPQHIYQRQPHSAGWMARRGELLWQLETGSHRQLLRTVRNLAGDYSSNDFINELMKPLNRWLREDARSGAKQRLMRFHDAVLHHSDCVKREALRHRDMPLLLEVMSQRDETEIWLEAIRLTGQGFCVEVDEKAENLMNSPERRHEHHLLWCGAGISPEHLNQFHRGLRSGKPMMLSGPDRTVRSALSQHTENVKISQPVM